MLLLKMEGTLLQQQHQQHQQQQRQQQHSRQQQQPDNYHTTSAEIMAQPVLGPQVAPRSRSRGSSIAPRYMPDGHASRPSAEMPRCEDYLTPYRRPSNTEMVLHQPPISSSSSPSPGEAYTPAVPEQYQAPPGTGRTLPPAQLGPNHPNTPSPSLPSDGYDQRPARPRYSSIASRRSETSGRSSNGRRSHESKRERRERQGRSGRPVSVPRNHNLNDDYTLTRRETPRGSV